MLSQIMLRIFERINQIDSEHYAYRKKLKILKSSPSIFKLTKTREYSQIPIYSLYFTHLSPSCGGFVISIISSFVILDLHAILRLSNIYGSKGFEREKNQRKLRPNERTYLPESRYLYLSIWKGIGIGKMEASLIRITITK